MLRFWPRPGSSVQLIYRSENSFGVVLQEQWKWPCGCALDSRPEAGRFRLLCCDSDDCIRDAETPWKPTHGWCVECRFSTYESLERQLLCSRLELADPVNGTPAPCHSIRTPGFSCTYFEAKP